MRSIKKDASPVLMAKNAIKSDFPIKTFITIIEAKMPESKYIRFKTIQELCYDKDNE